MINSTALANRAFLRKIGAAMAEAARNAGAWFPADGAAYVANRHARPVMRVCYRLGAGFEFYAGNQCMTGAVRAALARHGNIDDCPVIRRAGMAPIVSETFPYGREAARRLAA